MKKRIVAIVLYIFFVFLTSTVMAAFNPISTKDFGGKADATAYVPPTPPSFNLIDTQSFGGKVNATYVEPPPEFTPYETLTFGGKATTLVETTVIDVHPDTWDAATPNCGDSVTNNFTFYQNGTSTLNVKIGFNATNYTFVNYSTWFTNGHDQYCANFTIDSWSSETNIAVLVGDAPVTVLKSNLAGSSSFNFGIRIWMPKTVSLANIQEDFKVLLNTTVA
jgi:hypothetical protein